MCLVLKNLDTLLTKVHLFGPFLLSLRAVGLLIKAIWGLVLLHRVLCATYIIRANFHANRMAGTMSPLKVKFRKGLDLWGSVTASRNSIKTVGIEQ